MNKLMNECMSELLSSYVIRLDGFYKLSFTLNRKSDSSPCKFYTDEEFAGKDNNAKFISCTKTRIWPNFQANISCSIAGESKASMW